MFSVIIPLYNKSQYVEKCLISVLNQTFQDFEIIIVNDGSTDSGPEKVRNLKSLLDIKKTNKEEVSGNSHDDQLQVNGIQINNSGIIISLINQSNSGVSIARNNGAKASVYEYLAFLDADDWWEPTYLEEMKNLIEEFPEAGIYGSGYYLFKNGRKKIAGIGIEPGFEKGFINYFQVYAKTLCMPLWTGAVVIPKKIFEAEKGFNPTLKLGEDFDLWIRTASQYPVAFLNKPLACYNQDIELSGRAVGTRLYEPSEHMIFSDYSEFKSNSDFQVLYEQLALYDLLPYYLENKNTVEVNRILSKIHWKLHALKYRLIYLIFPKPVISVWMHFLKFASMIKRALFIL